MSIDLEYANLIGYIAAALGLCLGFVALFPWKGRQKPGRHRGVYEPQASWKRPEPPVISLWDKEFNLLSTIDCRSYGIAEMPTGTELTGTLVIVSDGDVGETMYTVYDDPTGEAGKRTVTTSEFPIYTLGEDGTVTSSRFTCPDNPVEQLIDQAEDLGLRVEPWQALMMRSWWAAAEERQAALAHG